MYEVYLSPQPTLNEEEANILELAADTLTPFATMQHDDFAEYTTGCQPYVLLLGVYLRLDKAMDVLKNYRAMIVEMVEDFDELGNLAVQMTETIKACESISDQISFASASVFSIDQEVFMQDKYSKSMLEKARVLLGDNFEEPDAVQLELHL